MIKKQPKIKDKIKELELENQTLKTKNQELIHGWQRTQADFENFRKRTAQERLELIKNANTDLVLAILPVLDNFTRAISHKPKELENNDYVKGLELTKNQLEQILAQNGLNKIEVKPGDQFDPNLHEAISTEKSDKFKEGQIISVIENGYKFGDKVLKPVKVKVAK